jgi:uncharacterized RDD family membrane protein YckC
VRNLAVRLSDSERHAAVTRLRDACAEGRITPDELSQRLELAFVARTAADLEPVLRDLPRRREWFATRRRYAAWWQRAAATVIDVVAVTAVGAIAPVGAVVLGSGYLLSWLLIAPVITVGYFTVCHGSRRGQTLGDYALEIAVRDESGGRLTYGQAFGRTLATLMFAAFWFMGGFLNFLWPLWDRRCQAWHDKVAATIVVRTSKSR